MSKKYIRKRSAEDNRSFLQNMIEDGICGMAFASPFVTNPKRFAHHAAFACTADRRHPFYNSSVEIMPCGARVASALLDLHKSFCRTCIGMKAEPEDPPDAE